MNRSLVELKEIYLTNERVRDYVNKYMNCHRMLNVKDALQCMIVKNYIECTLKGA